MPRHRLARPLPTAILHLLIPPLLLLATRRFPPRLVLALLPLSLLPDVDFFVPPHRALFHSAFLVAALLALWWHWRGTLAGRAAACLVGAYYLGSHSLMDLFAGGVVPFWPLSDTNFYFDAYVLIDTGTLEFFPTLQPGTEPGVPTVSPLYEAFNGDHAAIVALSLVVSGAWAVKRARERRIEEVVVVAPEPARRR